MIIKNRQFAFRLVACIIVLLAMVTSIDGYGQGYSKKKKRQMRKSNRKISSFSGRQSALNNSRRYASIGISINALNYYGDLAPKNVPASTDFSFTRPGLGISLQQIITPYVTGRVGFMYGRIRGDDFSAEPGNSNLRYERNLHFRNDIKELKVEGLVGLFPNVRPVNRRLGFNPYLFGGIAVFHHDPKAKVPETDPGNPTGDPPPRAGQWVSLQPLGTEGQHAEGYEAEPYSNFQVAIPFGVGMRLRVTHQLDFMGEFGLRYLFTDYLDDVSNNYPDPADLNSELARIMSQRSMEEVHAPSGKPRNSEYVRSSPYESGRVRGGSSSNDAYTMITLQVNYIFGTFF